MRLFKQIHGSLVIGFAAGALVSASAMGAAIGEIKASDQTYVSSGGSGYTNASAIPVSASDLINGLAATSTDYVGKNEAAGGSVNVLTDGSTGTGTSDTTSPTNSAFDIATGGWYAVWTLTSPASIGGVAVTTGHKDTRVNQRYDILLSTDGVNFTSLSDGTTTTTLGASGTGFNYSPASTGGAARSVVTPITGQFFNIAGSTSIQAVEFVAQDSGNGVFREVDALVTPEPSSVALLAVAAMPLLRRRVRGAQKQ